MLHRYTLAAVTRHTCWVWGLQAQVTRRHDCTTFEFNSSLPRDAVLGVVHDRLRQLQWRAAVEIGVEPLPAEAWSYVDMPHRPAALRDGGMYHLYALAQLPPVAVVERFQHVNTPGDVCRATQLHMEAVSPSCWFSCGDHFYGDRQYCERWRWDNGAVYSEQHGCRVADTLPPVPESRVH